MEEFGEITLRGSIVRLWSVRRLKELDKITLRRSASEALERKVK